MKNSIVLRSLSLWLLLALLAAGCGKLDDFSLDDFNPFVDSKTPETAELRRYALPDDSNAPLVETIIDASSKIGEEYSSNIRKTCDYTKIPFREVSIAAFNANPTPAATTRVLVIPEVKKLSQNSVDKLVEFVAGGGTLFVPYIEDDARMAFLYGFKTEAEYNTDINAKGFLFKVPMVPNFAGKAYQPEMKHYGFSADNFGPNIKVLATAVDDPKYPAILENQVGKGKVILYNSAISLSKIDRGLMFTGILKGLEGVPYPIANTATIFLDDFPSPLYNIKAEPIKSELNLTITDFVYKVWWPDMMDLAKKYKMSYAAMIAFDYKNKVEPPFIFDQWNENKLRTHKKIEPISDWLVYNVKENGHELAFHGYNHVSLQKGLWPNAQFVTMALKAVDKKWEINNFGPKPVTYVPPSNIIDGEGVNQVKAGMPSLKYMCSLYLGELAEGGGREFDFDPYNENMFDYPRISSGFYMDNQTQYAHESMWLYTGIWTHFVHPDDVYQIPDGYNKAAKGKDALRNGKNLGWRTTPGSNNSMLAEFDRHLKMVTTAFPQIRFLNGTQAGPIVNDWRASRFSHIASDGRYTVSRTDAGLSENQYWLVFASQQNAGKVENSLRSSSHLFSKSPLADGYIYSVFTNRPELTLRDLQYKDKDAMAVHAKLIKKVSGQYRGFMADVRKFQTGGGDWVDNSDELHKKELNRLLERMKSETTIDTAVWNQYTRFLSWDDRADEVWKIYEEHCLKNPSAANILYSKELANIVYYPNELTREKWLSAQMLVTPNDKDLLNSYVADFYTPENQAKIREALVNLLKVDTSFESYLKYIEYLLVYDEEEALRELEDKKPVVEFQPFATDAVWLFANNGLYAKAYEWSPLSGEIDFSSRMYWLSELKDYKTIESEYQKHIAQNPGDIQAMSMMAGVYQTTGRFRDAWVLTNQMPESPEKDLLRTDLNKYVIYEKPEVQQDLLNNHGDLFLPEVSRNLTRTLRRENSDFIALRSDTETNREDIQSFKNVVSYNHYDEKGNLHSFAGTYSTMYRNPMATKDWVDNVTHAIGGFQYQFTNPREQKYQYWFRGRGEYSDRKKMFFHLGSGISRSKEGDYKSAELKVFPAETGPAHSKSIYQTQLNLYWDFYAFSKFNITLSLEGDYYTAARTDQQYTIEESFGGFATTRLIWNDGKPRQSRFLPFLEAGMSQASVGRAFINPSSGYPYWMLDQRFNAGGGLGWKYGLPESDLIMAFEAGYFFDDYSDSFQRYSGEIAWQIFDFTQITASVQLFGQEKYFSNNIMLGAKYNLKKRKRK